MIPASSISAPLGHARYPCAEHACIRISLYICVHIIQKYTHIRTLVHTCVYICIYVHNPPGHAAEVDGSGQRAVARAEHQDIVTDHTPSNVHEQLYSNMPKDESHAQMAGVDGPR